MRENRYKEWIWVWEWFGATDRTKVVPKEQWNALYELLNTLWQDARKDATQEELAAHARAVRSLKQ